MSEREHLGHTVVNGEVMHLSVSSAEKFDVRSGGCPRRWWYAKVDGRGEEEKEQHKKSKQLGTDMHERLAHYEKTGEMVLAPLDLRGSHFIPPPGHDLIVEQAIHTVEKGVVNSVLTAAGIPFAGYIDLAHARGINYGTDDVSEMHDPPGTVELMDWKYKGNATTRDGLSTLLRPEQLIKTIQMSGYGEFARRIGYAKNTVRLSHGYFPAKGGEPRKVTKLHVVDECARAWEYVDALGRSIKDVARETVAEKVPANLSACGSYGGCPMRGFCKAAHTTSLSSLFGESEAMGLLEQLGPQNVAPAPVPQVDTGAAMRAQLAQEEANQRATVALQQQNTNAGIAAAWTEIISFGRGFPATAGEAARMLALATNQPPPVGAGFAGSGGLAAVTLTEPSHIPQLAAELAGRPIGIPAPVAQPAAQPMVNSMLPPDAPQSIPALAAKPLDAPGLGLPVAFPVTATVAGPVPTATVVEAAPATKKKRGRPASKPSESAPSQVVSTSATSSSPTVATEQTAGDDSDLEVFVDCMPMNVDFVSLWPYIDDLNAKLAARYCVDEKGQPTTQDIRCAPNNSVLGFGKWKGGIEAIMLECPPPDNTYVLDTRGSELGEAAANAMRTLCSRRGTLYCRGVR